MPTQPCAVDSFDPQFHADHARATVEQPRPPSLVACQVARHLPLAGNSREPVAEVLAKAREIAPLR